MTRIIFRQMLLLLEPVGLVWLALLILTARLWRRGLRKFAATTGALALFLIVVGSTGLSGALLAMLERPYAGLRPSDLPICDAAVLLGGSASVSRWDAGGFHLGIAGDRLLMAMEIMRLGKAPVLVIGGAGEEIDGVFRAESDLQRDWLIASQPFAQADPKAIVSLGGCADTHDEAQKVRALATARGWHRVLLVTSAWHMRRAAATFRSAGVEIVSVPCNFLTNVSTPTPPFTLAVPNHGQWEKLSFWLKEQLGWLEYRRRGWIAGE